MFVTCLCVTDMLTFSVLPSFFYYAVTNTQVIFLRILAGIQNRYSWSFHWHKPCPVEVQEWWENCVCGCVWGGGALVFGRCAVIRIEKVLARCVFGFESRQAKSFVEKVFLWEPWDLGNNNVLCIFLPFLSVCCGFWRFLQRPSSHNFNAVIWCNSKPVSWLWSLQACSQPGNLTHTDQY